MPGSPVRNADACPFLEPHRVVLLAFGYRWCSWVFISPTAHPDWLVLARIGDRPVLLELDRTSGRVEEAGPGAVAALDVALSTADAGGWACTQEPLPENLIRAVTRHLTTVRARGRAPASPSPRASAPRLARRVRRELANAGIALGPDLLGRADGLLRRLAAPLALAADRAIADLLDRPVLLPRPPSSMRPPRPWTTDQLPAVRGCSSPPG